MPDEPEIHINVFLGTILVSMFIKTFVPKFVKT